MIKTTTNCPTCGSECNVEGDTTQNYIPKFTQEMFDEKDKEIAELKRQLKSLQMKLFINNEM